MVANMTALNPKRREAVFRAIADPTRREILGLLRHSKHTVGELAGNFRTSRPAISKHLRLLRRVGLVVTKNEGTARICQLNAEPLVDPAQRMKWWGQKGRFETTNAESDLRPGGRWLMSGMGMERPFKVEGVYRIIERPRVLAFTWLPSWDEEATETLVRFDLDEQDGVTRVRLTHSGFATEGSRARHQGWPQILGWLRSYAEG